MTLLKICYYGNPVLRKKGEVIPEITDEIKQLAADMIETMLETNGIGLAAPQVGVSLRLFVSIVKGESEDGTITYTEPYAVINPILSNPSHTETEREEGCLSIPQLYVPVLRPLEIDIEALDLDGKRWKKRVHGFLARNFMHENDHLNGVLTVDRLKGKRRSQFEPALRLIKQKYKF